MKHKTQKGLNKRIKKTKNGKIMRKQMGINHFRSKKSGNARRGKNKSRSLNYPL